MRVLKKDHTCMQKEYLSNARCFLSHSLYGDCSECQKMDKFTRIAMDSRRSILALLVLYISGLVFRLTNIGSCFLSKISAEKLFACIEENLAK